MTLFSNAWAQIDWLKSCFYTGYSLSEALILASINPKYDDRMLGELQVQYIELFWMSKQKQFEQSVVMFWVHSCKNECFWQRITCMNLVSMERVLSSIWSIASWSARTDFLLIASRCASVTFIFPNISNLTALADLILPSMSSR